MLLPAGITLNRVSHIALGGGAPPALTLPAGATTGTDYERSLVFRDWILSLGSDGDEIYPQLTNIRVAMGAGVTTPPLADATLDPRWSVDRINLNATGANVFENAEIAAGLVAMGGNAGITSSRVENVIVDGNAFAELYGFQRGSSGSYVAELVNVELREADAAGVDSGQLSCLRVWSHLHGGDGFKLGGNQRYELCFTDSGGQKIGAHFDGWQINSGSGARIVNSVSFGVGIVGGTFEPQTPAYTTNSRGLTNAFRVEANGGNIVDCHILGGVGWLGSFYQVSVTAAAGTTNNGTTFVNCIGCPTEFRFTGNQAGIKTIFPGCLDPDGNPGTQENVGFYGNKMQDGTPWLYDDGLDVTGIWLWNPNTLTATTRALWIEIGLLDADGLPMPGMVRNYSPNYGTSADRYSFAGTGFRWPTTSGSNATNTFFATEFYFATPDYAITDPRVFAPSFWSPTTPGETYLAGGASMTIQGWAIETSAGVWTACDGALEAGVATLTNASAGALLPRVATTLTANTVYRARMTWFASAINVAMPVVTSQAGSGAPSGQERVEGSTTTRFARLSSTGANLSNSGGVFYVPSFMVAKGGDGRPAVLALGDSITFGANDSQATTNWGARKTIGYIERGLDENTTSQRLGYHIMGIPGQRPCGTDGWDVATNWTGKRAALQAVYDLQDQWPFDYVLNGHITNAVPYTADGGDLRIGMARYFDLLTSTWGKPITQIEGFPNTSATSDGYGTVAGQTAASGKAYPTSTPGHLWYFNDDVGADGIPDATKYYRTNGYIEDSFAPWRVVSADLSNDRDLWAVRAFSTTLSSAYVSGSSIVTVAAPTIGMALNVDRDSGGYGTIRTVISVTGSGPYTVGLNGTVGGAAAAGKTVREAPGDGLHPSGVMHINLLADEVVDWKVRRGWA